MILVTFLVEKQIDWKVEKSKGEESTPFAESWAGEGTGQKHKKNLCLASHLAFYKLSDLNTRWIAWVF